MALQIMSAEQAKSRGMGCHADRGGDCAWEGCPQLRDGEPEATGRHCPLDYEDADEC